MQSGPITDDAPLGSGHEVKDEHSRITLDAAGDSSHRESIGTRRVSALVATHALAHLTERRMTVAVRAQCIALQHGRTTLQALQPRQKQGACLATTDLSGWDKQACCHDHRVLKIDLKLRLPQRHRLRSRDDSIADQRSSIFSYFNY